jgi:hypothetical protein
MEEGTIVPPGYTTRDSGSTLVTYIIRGRILLYSGLLPNTYIVLLDLSIVLPVPNLSIVLLVPNLFIVLEGD